MTNVNNKQVSSLRYKRAYAYSEDSNQSAHFHSLIRDLDFDLKNWHERTRKIHTKFAFPHSDQNPSFLPDEMLDPWLPIENPSYSDQTAHIC